MIPRTRLKRQNARLTGIVRGVVKVAGWLGMMGSCRWHEQTFWILLQDQERSRACIKVTIFRGRNLSFLRRIGIPSLFASEMSSALVGKDTKFCFRKKEKRLPEGGSLKGDIPKKYPKHSVHGIFTYIWQRFLEKWIRCVGFLFDGFCCFNTPLKHIPKPLPTG